jgi:hypothetical protein
MSTLAPPASPMFGMPSGPVRRWTVQDYHQLIAAGILTENDPVELLEGFLVPKMPRNPQHDGSLELCQEAVRNCLPSGWKVRVQSAITMTVSEPEPDLVVVRETVSSHLTGHPEPHEIALVQRQSLILG